MLKLTFNIPAKELYFSTPKIKGVRFELINKSLEFTPVAQLDGKDIFAVSSRGRGGLEVHVEGVLEEIILSALHNPYGYPYFYLSQAVRKDWIATIPYEGPSEHPPRGRPHLRVWGRATIAADVPRPPLAMQLADIIEEVRRARRMVTAYRAEKRVGRKPSEIIAAEQTLSALQSLMIETIDLSVIHESLRLLSNFVEEYGGQKSNDELFTDFENDISKR